MKTLLTFSLALLFACAAPAQELINLGTAANDGTGDKLRAAGIKINTNAFNFDRRLDNIEGQTNQFGTGGSGITNVGSALLSASNYYARVVSLTTNDDIATIIAASANGTAYFLTPGYYTVTPAVARDTGSGAINIKGKTNILIQGVYGTTFIDGRSAFGENFWITNSSGITLRWLTSLGKVTTNFVTVAAPGQFSHVSYYNVEKLSIEENQFLHGYDHGTLDMASQADWTSVSTNFIRIVRNYFDNFGSSRTNESLAYDGTAIVPIAGVIEGNVIVNSLRGIEPYADGIKATGRVIDGQTFIRNNQIIDGLETGITFAGSTNIHGVVIENNTIRFTPGYSRRGTNTLTYAGGIEINGGQRHIVRGNKVYNPQYYGILVNATTTTGPAYGMVIEDNYIEGATNRYGAAAFGIYTADISDTLVNPIIDATISGNKLRRISHQALRVLGGRNVVVENNRFDDVAFPGFTAALQIQSSTSVSSNVTVRNNFITDRTGNLGTGISISAGTKAVRLMGNDVLGFTSVAVDNLAGPTESREYNTDASSTNRILRAHEVRTQIEAGSNITLATNSSGVVTITGAAGAASTNFITSAHGSAYVTNSVTAQSFIGSGTGVPILKLQTMMAADNAFAITVATNRAATTTNIFDFTSVSAAQVISAHSSSAGQVVWTNGAAAAGGGASVTFSAIPTALNSVSNYAKQLMFQSMKPNTSTSFDRKSAESPNTQGGAEVPPVNASLPLGLSATNHTGLYGWFPSTDLFHYSTRDHVSTFLVSFVGQTSSNRTWIGLSGAAAIYNTDVPGTPTYGFRHSSVVADNNWVCYSADGTRTVSNLVTTGSITTNVLYALATVKTGTNVIFYIDGSPRFTNHFDPAGAIMGYRIVGSKAGATGARSGIILHDYFSTTTIP